MVRYFYCMDAARHRRAVVLLSLPWLGLIALMIFSLVALAALAALAWAIVFVPYMLGRAISRHWQGGSGARQPSAAPSLAERTLKVTTRLIGSAAISPHPSRAVREPKAAHASRDSLFVIPGRGGGLRASIRGHLLELADLSSRGLAPTPDDLFIASIASDLAWSARHFLHAHGLPDDVSVSAEWRRVENPPSLADASMTVTVSETLEAMSDALEDALAERVAARSLDEPPRLHLRCAG